MTNSEEKEYYLVCVQGLRCVNFLFCLYYVPVLYLTPQVKQVVCQEVVCEVTVRNGRVITLWESATSVR